MILFVVACVAVTASWVFYKNLDPLRGVGRGATTHPPYPWHGLQSRFLLMIKYRGTLTDTELDQLLTAVKNKLIQLYQHQRDAVNDGNPPITQRS